MPIMDTLRDSSELLGEIATLHATPRIKHLVSADAGQRTRSVKHQRGRGPEHARSL